MKITDVKTFIVDGGRMNWVVVKIYTDAGISGVGDATVERRETAVSATIEHIKPYLLGKDPFATEMLIETANRDSYWRTGVINRSALSGIEAALFDIKGKALGIPVYELLGGKQRDRVKCYANYWAYSPLNGDDVARFLEKPLQLGFKAMKWDPFFAAYRQMSAAERRASIGQLRGARDAAGPDIDLLVEGHGRFDLPTARLLGDAIAEFAPLFFEEPLPPDSIDAYAELRPLISVPIAGGERYTEKYRFLEAIRRNALDWLQPDVCHTGGLLEMKKIAAIAEAAQLPFAPHNPMGPVGNAMTLHLAASTSNFALLETMMVDVPWRSEVATEHARMVDGHMLINDRPGLGIEFHEEGALRHPFSMKEPQHFKHRVYPQDLVPWYETGETGVGAG